MTHLEVRHASDLELLEATRENHPDAYGELWRRHSGAGHTAAKSIAPSLDPQDLTAEAFLKIFRALKSGKGPAGAFRPYLYQVQRALAADWLAERDPLSKTSNEPLESLPDLENPWPWDDQALDEDTAVQAFSLLEDRWQTVLWYTEVEQMPPRKVAAIMGTSANGVSKLAARAREGLRTAWLDAHLSRRRFSPECEAPLKNLRKLQDGKLSRSARAEVQSHLAECAACRNASEELAHVRQRLVAAVLVLIVGPGATAALAASFTAAAPAAAAGVFPVGSTPALHGGVALAKRAGNALKTPVGAIAATSVVALTAAGAFAYSLQAATPDQTELTGVTEQLVDDSEADTDVVTQTRATHEPATKETPDSDSGEAVDAPEVANAGPFSPVILPPGSGPGTGPGTGPGPRPGTDPGDGYDHTLKPNYLCYFEHDGPGSINISGTASAQGLLKVRITQPPSSTPVELIVAQGVTTGTDAEGWWFTESLTPLEKWPGLLPGEIRESTLEIQLITSDGRRSPWNTIVLPETVPPIETCT